MYLPKFVDIEERSRNMTADHEDGPCEKPNVELVEFVYKITIMSEIFEKLWNRNYKKEVNISLLILD